MNPKKEIEKHRLPCGPMSISIDGVCRKRLRDHFDSLLDRLTLETHPEGADSEAEDLQDEHEMQEESKKVKKEVDREIDKDKKMLEKSVDLFNDYESPEDQKKRLIEEGKMKAEVKHEVRKHAEKLMGNSKMLQDPSGKIKKR